MGVKEVTTEQNNLTVNSTIVCYEIDKRHYGANALAGAPSDGQEGRTAGNPVCNLMVVAFSSQLK